MKFMARKIFGGGEGQALVEFAIVLPILMILLVGMMEFGLLFYNKHVITNASREGARYGIVVHAPRRSADQIKTVVSDYCGDRLITFGAGPLETEVEALSAAGTPIATSAALFSDELTVTVTFHYDFLALPNFVAALIGGTDLEAETTMKYE